MLAVPALVMLLAFQPACDLTDSPINFNCPDSVPSWPFGDPLWHPGGQVVGFNYWPAQEIIHHGAPCYGVKVKLEPDSAGFWLIDADGANARRIFPEMLRMPSWSPSGDWIAFMRGLQIYKMRFTGESFDTSSVIRLTHGGWNTYPVWSPDGEWLAWDPVLDVRDSLHGIWIMRNDGSEKQSLLGGNTPTWHPDGSHILGTVPMPGNTWRFVRYYPFTAAAPETLSVVIESDGTVIKYSPDGAKVAYWPGQLGEFQLLVIGSDGTGPEYITNVGVIDNEFTPFDWHPGGSKIVFMRIQLEDPDNSNASLWSIDLITGEENLLKLFSPNL